MTDQTAQLKTIAERLEELEKQNRRMKRAGLFALAAASALLLMGQTAPQFRTVEAERFVLRDSKGKVRGALGMRENGPRLELYDAEGDEKEARAVLAVVEHSPSLWLSGPKGNFVQVISNLEASALLVSDSDGKTRVQLGMGKGWPGPGIGFYDPNGKTIYSAPPNLASVSRTDARPRVFIEKWLGETKQENLGDQWSWFSSRCGEAVATTDMQASDYTLRVSTYLLRSFITYSLLDKSGTLIASTSKDDYSSLMDSACQAVAANWATKDHTSK
jgi:hypothetical protein